MAQLKGKNVAIAGLTLRLAWLYRSLNNSGQEERFMKLARDYYMESYSTEDYSSTQMSAVRIMYMIAELSRRIGDIENATRFFLGLLKTKCRWRSKIIDMAKEQWAIIREEKNMRVMYRYIKSSSLKSARTFYKGLEYLLYFYNSWYFF